MQPVSGAYHSITAPKQHSFFQRNVAVGGELTGPRFEPLDLLFERRMHHHLTKWLVKQETDIEQYKTHVALVLKNSTESTNAA